MEDETEAVAKALEALAGSPDVKVRELVRTGLEHTGRLMAMRSDLSGLIGNPLYWGWRPGQEAEPEASEEMPAPESPQPETPSKPSPDDIMRIHAKAFWDQDAPLIALT